MRAGAIAEASEFFSFGTNDLTQTTYGISRDDASTFMNTYMQKGLMARDPFMTLDLEGVGEIIRLACERGTGDPPRHCAGRLRRTWRRTGIDPLLRRDRPRLCFLLALPRAHCKTCGRAGRYCQAGCCHESFLNWSTTASQASPRRNRCAVSAVSDWASMVMPSGLSVTRTI